ncbi:hypothetical protein RRF57_005886 [Xylaria bambusicola]|uniref:Uncharacterized protein n=1 Tax=Xylaria bambusicola TaxID=326684 RepID=A0AAN7Z9I4_9PEZI
MGNSNSTPSVPSATTHLSIPASAHSSPESIEPHRTFSVSPFEHSTFISVTKLSSKSYSHGSQSTRTGEYCTWDWKKESSSCTVWTFTVDAPTPFTFPTPTGGYETSEVSFSSFSSSQYTCTDFLCIDSVASQFGFSLCLETATPTIRTLSWPQEFTTDDWPTVAPTCDPELDWNCPSSTSEILDSTTFTDEWPTIWPTIEPPPTLTLELPTETSSDYEETSSPTTLSTTTTSCEYANDCLPPIHHTTIRETSSLTTTTKHSYSYPSTSTHTSSKRTTALITSECDSLFDDCTSTGTRRTTTSECLWFEDCTPTVTAEPTTWAWDPVPWSGYTISTTIKHRPHWTAGAQH